MAVREPELTNAQRRALAVMVAVGPVRGSRQASRFHPTPLVNSTAAFSLVRMGLARAYASPYRSVFTSGYDFDATPEGRKALDAQQ